MRHQVEAVRKPLSDERWSTVPVTAAVLFVSNDNWPLLQTHPLKFGDVYALWGKALGKLVREPGPVSPRDVLDLERVLCSQRLS